LTHAGRIILATEPDGSFGTRGRSWMAVESTRIAQILGEQGFEVRTVRVDRLLELDLRKDDQVFYVSAFNPALRTYIRDILYFAGEKAKLVPDYRLLLAHENKGFQELLKASLGIGSLEGSYGVDFDERSMHPPYVFKTSTGAGSAGVHLVRSPRDERRIQGRYFARPFLARLKALVRRRKLKPEELDRYLFYYKPFRPYVTQRFVEGLTGDLKILVFGDRFYTLWRENRPGDFRASGSGRLDFDRPASAGALDFARDVAERLGSPYLSLDIAEGRDGHHLLEFQALYFGPTTLTLSNGYYVLRSGAWERVSAEPDLEESFAHAIAYHLRGSAEAASL
jgi:hypothetical protein